jgi:ribosomal protein S27AE
MVKVEHMTKKEIEKNLGNNEIIEEDKRCPNCGGYLITNYGAGMSCTFCMDCLYDEYDYDL